MSTDISDNSRFYHDTARQKRAPVVSVNVVLLRVLLL